MSRKNRSSNDRMLEEEVGNSLKMSTYEDQIIQAMITGTKMPEGYIPDYSTNKPMRRTADGGFGKANHTTSNESGSLFSMFDQPMFDTGPDGLDHSEGGQTIQHQASNVQGVSAQKYLSANQIRAIKKYPALIDLLGSENGEFLVKEIAAKVNQQAIQKVTANSKEINSLCQGCVADKQNVKAFFLNEEETRVCVVTASGTFRGDESFFYSFEKDNAQILRKMENGEFENITSSFNMIHEMKEKEN